MKKFIAIAYILLITFTGAMGATVASFTGEGFISQNRSYVLSADTGFITEQTPVGSKNKALFVMYTPDHDDSKQWNFRFKAASGQALTEGRYEVQTRYTSNSTLVGMSIGGQGRGSATIDGWFEILKITWDGSTITEFAVDFYQRSEGGPDYILGSQRFQSNIPITPIPEPATLTLFAVIGGLALIRRKR